MSENPESKRDVFLRLLADWYEGEMWSLQDRSCDRLNDEAEVKAHKVAFETAYDEATP